VENVKRGSKTGESRSSLKKHKKKKGVKNRSLDSQHKEPSGVHVKRKKPLGKKGKKTRPYVWKQQR